MQLAQNDETLAAISPCQRVPDVATAPIDSSANAKMKRIAGKFMRMVLAPVFLECRGLNGRELDFRRVI